MLALHTHDSAVHLCRTIQAQLEGSIEQVHFTGWRVESALVQ